MVTAAAPAEQLPRVLDPRLAGGLKRPLKVRLDQRIDCLQRLYLAPAGSTSFDMCASAAAVFDTQPITKQGFEVFLDPFAIYVQFLLLSCNVSFNRLRA